MSTFQVSSETTASANSEGTGYYEVAALKEWYTFGCFPCRYALLVLATLLALMSLISVIMGSVIYNILGGHVTEFQNVAIIMHLFIYTVLCFFCGFGLYSGIYRSSGGGSTFCAMLIGHILFEITSGAICLYFLFNKPTDKRDAVSQREECMKSVSSPSSNLFIQDLCHRTFSAQLVCLFLFLFMWVLQLVTFYAGNRYVGQLQEEDEVTSLVKGKDLEGFASGSRHMSP